MTHFEGERVSVWNHPRNCDLGIVLGGMAADRTVNDPVEAQGLNDLASDAYHRWLGRSLARLHQRHARHAAIVELHVVLRCECRAAADAQPGTRKDKRQTSESESGAAPPGVNLQRGPVLHFVHEQAKSLLCDVWAAYVIPLMIAVCAEYAA